MISLTALRCCILLAIFQGVLCVSKSCNDQWDKGYVKQASITFIIPSAGRNTILTTFDSLFNQTDMNWLAIVVFDGVASSDFYQNNDTNIPTFLMPFNEMYPTGRICFQHRIAIGSYNCAAHVRNYAVTLAVTPWVGFVDDDDSLSSRYVEVTTREVSAHSSLDVIVYRMTDGKTLFPPADHKNLFMNSVGISFATKRSLWSIEGYNFTPSSAEDYLLLHRLRGDGKHILLSADIMYYVKNFLPSEKMLKDGMIQRAVIKNDHDPLIKQSKIDLKDAWLAATGKKSCVREPKAPPKFVYTELSNIFFQSNVAGLNQSIHKAISNGCLSRWAHGRRQIHVVFTATALPINSDYIQVQMEQYNTKHFSHAYGRKLQNALQVWEFSPAVLLPGHAANRVYSTPRYYIPTILSLPHTVPIYDCAASKSLRPPRKRGQRKPTKPKGAAAVNGMFHLYRQGFYRKCALTETGVVVNGPVRLSNDCVMFNASSTANLLNADGSRFKKGDPVDNLFTKDGKCVAFADVAVNKDDTECSRAATEIVPVLSYGAMEGSYRRGRESLCDQMHRNITLMNRTSLGGSVANAPNVLCIIAFGPVLKHFVCKASIVVVEHYFSTSALETHRIDPLLQARKVVVVTPSSDPVLDEKYRPFLILTPKKGILMHVNGLLSRTSAPRLSSDTAKRFEIAKTTLDPLCHALRGLGADYMRPRNTTGILKKQVFRLF